jgi:hypothetical protein
VRVERPLKQFGIDSVQLCVAPLASYGEYDWYAPPPEVMSERFSLVVCDGPPSQTRGGRYGLVPVMNSRFVDDCVILLDDAERGTEQAIALRWAEEFPFLFTRVGIDKPFFRLVLGKRPSQISHSPISKEQYP